MLAKPLSVNRLAQMAGLNEKAIRLIEKEERMPSLPTAIRLTKALGLKLSDLVSDAEGRVPNDST
ncbi:MAG: helix-turn-helix domain-containing protein [Verrucomicrobiales bacterium]|nr:helix-turn-helix domain-containing protein [Verrucomicrobiales bacterium]